MRTATNAIGTDGVMARSFALFFRQRRQFPPHDQARHCSTPMLDAILVFPAHLVTKNRARARSTIIGYLKKRDDSHRGVLLHAPEVECMQSQLHRVEKLFQCSTRTIIPTPPILQSNLPPSSVDQMHTRNPILRTFNFLRRSFRSRSFRCSCTM